MSAEITSITARNRSRDFNRIMSDALSLNVLTSLHEAGELEAGELADALLVDVEEVRQLLIALEPRRPACRAS